MSRSSRASCSSSCLTRWGASNSAANARVLLTARYSPAVIVQRQSARLALGVNHRQRIAVGGVAADHRQPVLKLLVADPPHVHHRFVALAVGGVGLGDERDFLALGRQQEAVELGIPD